MNRYEIGNVWREREVKGFRDVEEFGRQRT